MFVSIVSGIAPAQEPLRVRRNLFGMHNLKDGGPAFDIGMEWTQQMTGTGYVFDWVTDINPWIEKAFHLNLVPCIRVQECNGGCTPGAWYASNVAWTVLNYKIAHLQMYLSGQDLPQTDAACDDAKLDADNDVDADDVTRFLNCFTGSGPNIAFVPGCGD